MPLPRPWVVALFGSLCAGILASCGERREANPAPGEMEARPVRVAIVEERPMERSIPVTGTLGARESSVLGAKVAGRVQSVAVDVGSRVRRGDLLVQIEPRDYELRERQAAATLSQARSAIGLPIDGDDDRVELESMPAVQEARTLRDEATRNRDRLTGLSASGIVSQSDVDAVRSAYDVAGTRYERALEEARSRMATVAQRRAELEIARKQLADAAVRAPFDGVVQRRIGNVGEYIAAGAPVVSLVGLDPLRLRLEVPEREAASVEAGQAVRLLVEGDDRSYAGTIARLSPALDEESRVLRIEADVPASGTLRPGLFARAQIVLREAESALCVPSDSIVTFAGIEKVVVVENGAAREKTVTTGRRAAGCVEIVSGVAAGETIVLDPTGIRSGQPVTVTTVADTPASATARDGAAGR